MPVEASIATGSIRHHRFRPVERRFAYRGYFVRLPMRSGKTPNNWWFGINRFALLSFHHADHGDGTSKNCLPWLEQLLHQAGVQANGEIWLHTFARVLGFGFKPVSFWFCHHQDGALAAIVAEVHNTFGERHSYVLQAPAGAQALRFGQTLHAPKRFHVSPFLPVQGEYAFRFMQTAAVEKSVARVDYLDAQGTLLQTSISGTHTPLTQASVLKAFFGLPLFSFTVVARIHWQALQLWLKKVPFFRKPTAPVASYTPSAQSAHAAVSTSPNSMPHES
jgi:uncharacterized protein